MFWPFRVALRKESVDRNFPISEPSEAPTVALRKESVDRNTQRRDFKRLGLLVALRKESVDRNFVARRGQGKPCRRSPQGERG